MQGLRNKLHDILRPNKSSPSRSEISPPVATSLGGDQPRVQNDVSPSVEETPSPLGEAIPPPNQARLPLKASSHIQVEIWTEAYDGLKKDEPETVEAYEKILSGQLSSGGPAIDVEGDHENIIQAGTVTRRDQMKKLIEEGQARTEKVANMKANVNEVVEPFNRLREVISLAVKSDPAASTAWLGITTLLDILASPLSEPGANREGMKYILERAEWYWNLSALVLDPDKVDESIEELQKSLKNNILKLYKKLLLYQMKSVCLYARSEPAVILRDLVKLDDWKAQIASIEKTAEGVRNNVSQFRGEDMSARFRSIDKHLEGVQTHLRSLAAAIQDLGLEQRQQHDNDNDKRFLNDLYDVDPRLEKSALEDLKGGMVKEAHDLVYDQSDFETLRADASHDLIWITGHPGRGKTMFLCGVIERLIQQKQLRVVSYFFCRADRQKARSAKAVLRGLLWMICNQSWGIARRLRQEYEKQSRKLFDDDDSMVSVVLEKMLDDVLGEPAMRQAVIVVDAIDECDDDSIRTLLKAIARLSRDHPAQWIVSSRVFSIYRSIITSTAPGIITCHMELSEGVVSSAVHAFVKHKVNTLAEAKGYDEDLQNHVYTTLSAKANDTFLWVALVCLELDGLGVEPRHVTETLDAMPRGLDKLYQRMLDRAFKSNDARLCRQILPLVCLASRPLAFNELCTLVPGLQSLRESDLRGVVANCGSFLAIHGDEENSILAFIHQSAREYLMDQARENVFPLGLLHHHRQILGWALTNIKQLRRNIYNLPSLGVTIGEIVRPDPDPLSHLHYSCVHWLDHFNSLYGKAGWQASDREALHAFIEADFLHWLEALGLMASIPRGITAFQQLVRFYREEGEFHELRVALDDARRFMLYNKTSIEVAPLQVYASALVFCPSSSVIRSNFKDELNWATLHPRNSGATWSQLIQELPCETWPSCMAFSADGLWLVTGITHYIGKSNSHEHFIEIWDVLASHRVQSFPIDYFINKVQFSADGSEVVVALSSGDVRRLEADSGRCIGSFTHDRRTSQSVFSKETKFVAHSIYDHTLTVFRVATGEHVQNIKDVLSLCFSPDSSHLATRLTGNRVAMWRVGNDSPLWIIEADTRCLSFFGNGQVAIRCENDTIAIRAGVDGTLIRTIPCHPNIYSIAWLGSGLSFLSWGHKNTIKIWDDSGISCVQTLPVTEQSGNSKEEGGWYTISTATNFVAWVGDPAIRLWDLKMRASPDALDEDPSPTRHSPVSQISFSPNPVNGPLFASYSHSGVKVWDMVDNDIKCCHTLDYGYRPELTFSPDGQYLVACDINGFFSVWETADGTVCVSQKRFSTIDRSPAFSPDGKRVALALGARGVSIWDFAARGITQTMSQPAEKVIFSPDGNTLAISHHDNDAHQGHIEILDASSLSCLHTLDFHNQRPSGILQYGFTFLAYSPDSKSLAVATNTALYIWPLGASQPSHRIKWSRTTQNRSMGLAISPNGQILAAAMNHEIWLWDLGQAEAAPLQVEIPHITRLCQFNMDSTKLMVDGGIIDVATVGTGEGNKNGLLFRGYGMSEDCQWITKDKQRLLYLPPEYRPRGHPKDSFVGETAFMGSTVVIGTDSGHVHVLRFDDELSARVNK